MIDAILFDIDGTLIDSDPIHVAVFADLLAEHGQEIDEAFYLEHVHGRLNADVFAELLPDEDPEAMSDLKEAEYRRRLERHSDIDRRVPGVTAFIGRCEGLGLKLAAVTNAPRDNAPASLAAVGLADRFETLVVAADVPRGKPAPDPYLEAMRRLGVTPERCLIFEDSPSGIAAGLAAGAQVIGLSTSLSRDEVASLGVDLVIANYNDPALDAYLAKFEGALT